MASTILVVEDDEGFRELVAETLAQGGYRVLKESDGLAAWRLLRRRKVDLAVLDLNLPGLDGLELTRRIRGDEGLKGLPVLMLTVQSLADDQVRGYERGADDYLTKPFESRMLLARVRALERRTKSA